MLSVGIGNGLTFRELNGLLPSFDNTFLTDESFINIMINKGFIQEYFTGDTLVYQVKVASGEVPTSTFVNSNDVGGSVTGALKSSYTDYDFYEFTKTFGSGDAGICFYFKVLNSGDDTWQSEPIKVINESETYITGTNVSSYTLLEWYNYDSTTGRANNNFEMDYSTGIVPFVRIPAVFKDYEPKVEISVYENLDEATKLKEKVQRTIELKSEAVPRFFAEKLVIFTAHDSFYVNNINFVREEKPDISQLENNLTEFSAVLTQFNVLGLNTSDIGFDCDGMADCKVDNQQELAVSTNTTFTILADHGLDTITIWYNSGSDILVKFGTTVGGTQIGQVRPGASEADSNVTLNVPQDLAKTGTGTLYVDVSGTAVNVDIFVRTIQNRVV